MGVGRAVPFLVFRERVCLCLNREHRAQRTTGLVWSWFVKSKQPSPQANPSCLHARAISNRPMILMACGFDVNNSLRVKTFQITI